MGSQYHGCTDVRDGFSVPWMCDFFTTDYKTGGDYQWHL